MADRELLLRHNLLRTVIVALFLILLGNLFVMMITRHGEYEDQALENRQIRLRKTAPRGRIFDRNGELLAVNLYIADITVPHTCLTAEGADSTLTRLIEWFGLDSEATVERLEAQTVRGGSLVLVPDASPSRVTTVEEYERILPGVRVVSRPRRLYPHKELMAHVVGYVGEVGVADLDTTGDVVGYRQGDIIGKQGVEAAMEDVLRGRNGVRLEEVNASGRFVGRRPQWLLEVLPGQDVTLTLDVRLQRRLADAIGERTACGIALDVRSGAVLAAYSNPSFDPNLLTASLSEEQWRRLIEDPEKPFFNRIVQATYPPASLYKPIVSLAGLRADLIGKRSVLEPCLGGWTFGDRFFRCWKRIGHGTVDHVDAIVNSCDTFYYQLGLRLDIDTMAAAARAFGLGSGVTRIFADEAQGNVPDSDWYDARDGVGHWTRGVLLNNAIGQGELLVTPIQMAVVVGRLASGGTMPDPVFVIDPPLSPGPELKPLPFAAEDLAWVRSVLRETVERGTGRAAELTGIAVAGKTGTAQNPHGDDHAWFMCFAPHVNPEVALAVIVENGGHGSSAAAPIAGAWLSTYFGVPGVLEGEAAPAEIPGGGD